MQSLLLTALRLVTVSAEWREKASEVLREAKNGEKEPSNPEVRESLCQDVSRFQCPPKTHTMGKLKGLRRRKSLYSPCIVSRITS